MATIKSYTDISQSKKLAEILSLESADMGYLWNGTSFCEYPVSKQTIFKRVENIPCWSLAALLDVLQDFVLTKYVYHKGDDIWVKYMCKNETPELFSAVYDNPVDACVEMIIRLNEQNLL